MTKTKGPFRIDRVWAVAVCGKIIGNESCCFMGFYEANSENDARTQARKEFLELNPDKEVAGSVAAKLTP